MTHIGIYMSKIYTSILFSFVCLSQLASGNIDSAIRHWRIQTSLYTIHYDPKPVHNNQQKLLNLEYINADNWTFGFATFRNSFDQSTQYAYAGHDWALWSNAEWQIYASVSAGFLHGYKGEHKDKIPLNRFGIAPVILPSIGVEYKNSVFAKVQLFATAGMMATVGYRF